jgi:dTDP-4-dehydrorhamnose reductase
VKIFIIGANGLIGSRLSADLFARGHEVLGMGRGERRAPGSFRFVSGDLGNATTVASLLQDERPDVIVNTAGMRDVDGCERAPEAARIQNVQAVEVLAKETRRIGALLIQVSTDYVFDGKSGPYSEEDPPSPLSVYGKTKWEGELAAREAGRWAVARTAVVYGRPWGESSNFGIWLWNRFRSGEPVTLFKDQWVSPTYAGNAAEMLSELCERQLEGVWHLAGSQVVSRVEFGEAFCETFGFERTKISPTSLMQSGLSATRPVRAGLRTDKAKTTLSRGPKALTESLRAFAQELRA